MATKTKKPRKRTKQTYIPGTEPPVVKEVERAAVAYVDVRDQRMKLTTEEVEGRDEVIELMKKHGLEVYQFNLDGVDYEINLKSESKVKVKKHSHEANGEAE